MFTKSAEFYDAVYSFKNYALEVETLRAWIDQTKRSPGRTLLDVACGTGAHLPTLKPIFTCEGLDLDPELLAQARRRHPELTFYQGDMADFDLGRQFDIVTCLFSSIGYVGTQERLDQTLRNFARHTVPGGVVVVEPWLTPERYFPGRLHALFVDEPDLKIARMNISTVENGMSILNFHYLVGAPHGIEFFTERHELRLFSDADYRRAFEGAGLETSHDPEGLTGRGLYIGVKPTE